MDPYALIAAFYDETPLYRARNDVSFYLERARRAGGPVLELGCGSGRVLVPIARAGIDITGLDASESMLAICRERLARETLAVPLILGDLRTFELRRCFSLITLPFRPFQHLLEAADQMACLAAVRRHLAPGGRLIFDVFDPDLKALASENTEWVVDTAFTMADGRRVERGFRRVAHDPARQYLHLQLRHQPDGEPEAVMDLHFRYCFRWELEHLLARCGYRVLETLGDFDGGPPGRGELIFVAEAQPRVKTQRSKGPR